MKKLCVLCILILLLSNSCKDNKTSIKENNETKEIATSKNYAPFGKEINEEHALTAKEMQRKYSGMKEGDTLDVKFVSSVNSICKNKGCWMRLGIPENNEVMVQFKDYAFFVPKDIEEKEVVVQGKAFVAEVSVKDLQHFARDKGNSEEEIKAITQPEKRLSFLAEGVLVEN